MGKTHREQLKLATEVEKAKSKITIGARYWHHKSKDEIYTVVGLGFIEATDELCVIYQAEYGEKLTFLRPLSVWLEQVERQGQTVQRFTQLDS